MGHLENLERLCYTKPEKLEPNPDLGGIGVLIGFICTAWFVTFLAFVRYVISFDPNANPFPDKGDIAAVSCDTSQQKANMIDEHVIGMKLVQWLRQRSWFESPARWEGALRKSALSLCDVQLLTGLGILFSGYINLGLDAISAYHWHMVVYLAWFSNLTHIACLTLLRGYLHLHQNERRWRLALMLILWMLLLVAIGPTLWMNWMHDDSLPGLPSSNARCFYHPSVALKTIQWRTCEYGHEGSQESTDRVAKCVAASDYSTASLSSTEAFQSAVTSIVLTVFTFFTRMAKIIQQWSITIRRNARSRVNKLDTKGISSLLQKSRTGWRARFWTSILFIRVATNLTARVYADLLSSELSDVYWLFVSTVWGTLRIIGVRLSVTVDEDSWEFGQILPVFLLIGPIMTMVLPMIVSRHMATVTPGVGVSTVIGSESHSETHGIPQRLAETDPTESDRTRPRAAQLTLPRNTELASWEEVTASAEPTQDSPSPTQPLDNALGPLSKFLLSARRAGCTSARLTAEDVDNQLRSYYRRDQWMEQVTVLACLQVVPVTVMIIIGTSGRGISRFGNTLLVTLSYSTTIFLIQPLNCLFALLFDLISDEEHPFRKRIFRLPLIVWGLLLILIMPLQIAGIGYDVAYQLMGFAFFGVSLFLAPKVFKRRITIRTAHHGVDNA